jgi:hypothetical protein
MPNIKKPLFQDGKAAFFRLYTEGSSFKEKINCQPHETSFLKCSFK